MDNVTSPFEQLAALSEYRFRTEIWAVLGCVVLFASIIELVRRDRLKERYSFLWLITTGVLITFILRRDWLEDFSRMLGVYYPPTALFLLLVFFMLLILVQFSTAISKLLTDKQSLVQSLGALEARVRELETDSDPSPNSSPNLSEDTSSTSD
ncbi:MAG: DUF2304 domain-containing protein [Oligoflexia bacterium]|nr:DUF2304 domain-containing protein [Oligoflexia bacterium]